MAFRTQILRRFEMMKPTYFNHLDRQARQISLHILGWPNILNCQSAYMGEEFWTGRCGDLLITEACSRSAFILEPDLTLWQIHSMVDARNQRVHIQTTAAGQWGEGVQPEPPEPSARDGGADTKKPANDPVGVAARVRHQNADFAFLVKPLPCESTTYAHFCGSFVVATA